LVAQLLGSAAADPDEMPVATLLDAGSDQLAALADRHPDPPGWNDAAPIAGR
jgi:hypothetical protein